MTTDNAGQTSDGRLWRDVIGSDDYTGQLFLVKEAAEILAINPLLGEEAPGGVVIEDIRVKISDTGNDPVLCIVKGIDHEGTPVIGFHAGGCFTNALAGLARRLEKGTIKWRVDEWRSNLPSKNS